MINFGSFDPKELTDWSLLKLKFSVVSDKGESLVEFIFNSDFGLRIINKVSTGPKKDNYLDLDLDFRKTTKKLFLILHGHKLYIAVNGLSFADIIFVDDFSEAESGSSFYRIVTDQEYSTP